MKAKGGCIVRRGRKHSILKVRYLVLIFLSILGAGLLDLGAHFLVGVEADLREEAVDLLVLTAVASGVILFLHLQSLREQRRADLKLIHSEERLRSLIDNNPDAIGLIDPEGRVTYANPVTTELFGYSADDWMNRSIFDFVVPADKDYMQQIFPSTLTGDNSKLEIRALHKRGHSAWVSMMIVPVIVDEQVVGLYCIAKDITERKRAEAELRESKQQLESFFNNTSDTIIISDKEGRIVRVNRAFEQTFGWTKEEVMGKVVPMSMADQLESYREIWKQLEAGETLPALEKFDHRKDGTAVYVSVNFSPVRNHEGKMIAMAGIGRDMSERRRSEQALQQAQQELQETVHQQQGIIFKYRKVGGEYIHTLCDGQMLGRLGMRPGDVIGRTCREIFPKEQAESILPYYDLAWEGQDVTYEFLSSEEMVSLVSLKPLFRDGEVAEVIGSSIDITELKRTQDLLRKSDKLSIVGELAAGVAHEIRNPLTPLRGFVQLLQNKSPEHRMYYEIMLSEIDRINTIVSEFMVLAKPQPVAFREKDLRHILQTIIQVLEAQANLYNVQFALSFPPEMPRIKCEENQLKQVFINILKNAIDAMPDGGLIRLQVVCPDEDHVTVQVIDNGCGIPPERLPVLGEPFYTTKEKGTGLGLMVSYRIIENHQGTIEITSEVGRGTEVSVTLPVSF